MFHCINGGSIRLVNSISGVVMVATGGEVVAIDANARSFKLDDDNARGLSRCLAQFCPDKNVENIEDVGETPNDPLFDAIAIVVRNDRDRIRQRLGAIL